MKHAETCPICKGTGETFSITKGYGGRVEYVPKVCLGCDGKCWVHVDDGPYIMPSKVI